MHEIFRTVKISRLFSRLRSDCVSDTLHSFFRSSAFEHGGNFVAIVLYVSFVIHGGIKNEGVLDIRNSRDFINIEGL